MQILGYSTEQFFWWFLSVVVVGLVLNVLGNYATKWVEQGYAKTSKVYAEKLKAATENRRARIEEIRDSATAESFVRDMVATHRFMTIFFLSGSAVLLVMIDIALKGLQLPSQPFKLGLMLVAVLIALVFGFVSYASQLAERRLLAAGLLARAEQEGL